MTGKQWVSKHLFRRTTEKIDNGDVDLTAWLGRLRLASTQQSDNLELTPLVLDGEPGAEYVMAAEAIDRGLLDVVESGAGVVQTVHAGNRGDRPVLVLEGDTLVGCKQNRVVAHSIIIAPGVGVDVQVGCMEAGRWSWRGRRFQSGQMRVSPSLRKFAVAEVLNSRRSGQRARLDQSRLWSQIASSLQQQNVRSSTGDYHRFIEHSGDEAGKRAERFTPVKNQVGVIATWKGKLLGLELVGHPECWSRLSRRTLPSYILAAAEADGGYFGEPPGPARSAGEWFELLRRVPVRAEPAAGLGFDLDITTGRAHGTGLWYAGDPAYLALFPH